ncbi:MAG TPA: pre-peptidase C-terminal domain-containing protein [Methylomirabilota bacterium]|jgi:hypothetical protein|nr:pre-peptidase C-terminal domain-containing protein [Methylomirabilota bacterium]
MNRRTIPGTVTLVGVFVLTLLAVPMGQHVHAASIPLFHDMSAPAGASVAPSAAPDVFARNTRYVQLDLSALAQTRTTLNMFPGKGTGTLVAVWDRVEQISADTYAWIGHADGVDLSDVTLVVNTTEGIMAGSVTVPGALYRIRYAGQGAHAVEEVDADAFPDDVVVPVKTPFSDTVAAAEALADGAGTIDVLVVYSPAARIAAGGTTAMNTLIALAITETNQGYANSGVTHRLRLVHKAEVVYTESGNFSTDLSWVTGNATVAALRNTYGADLVSFVIEGNQFCGIAWLMTTVSTAFAGNGFSVTARTCATGYYSFAHEIGHNMGARHDWFVDAMDNSPYSYNHGFVATNKTWRTIMAYGNDCSNCTRINRWSNPSLMYNSVPTGVPEGQFHAADNHRTLNNTAATVANFRQSVVGTCSTAPTITPTSRSATAAGGANTVGVTAVTGCAWTATSNVAWITITSGASGTGNGTVGYTVATNTGAARTGTATIAGRTFTVNQGAAACNTTSAPGCLLTSGVAKTAITGAAASTKYYYIDVPANATKLVVQTSGGSGNVNLYVRRGSAPTTTTFDCRPNIAGNAETCTHNNPATGRWYIMLRGAAAYSSVTLKATITTCSPNASPGCPLTNGVGKGSLSGALSSTRYYYIDVPSGRPSLKVTTTGGSGDVDLFVRRGGPPTRSTFDCRSDGFTTTETCTITSPVSGRFYIMLFGYATYSGVTLKAQH